MSNDKDTDTDTAKDQENRHLANMGKKCLQEALETRTPPPRPKLRPRKQTDSSKRSKSNSRISQYESEDILVLLILKN